MLINILLIAVVALIFHAITIEVRLSRAVKERMNLRKAFSKMTLIAQLQNSQTEFSNLFFSDRSAKNEPAVMQFKNKIATLITDAKQEELLTPEEMAKWNSVFHLN